MRVVFDTEAILKFFLGESGAEKVKNYLERCMEGKAEGFVSLINLTEFYYILCRKNEKLAEEKLTSLRGYGLEEVGADDREIWKKAARIKASKAIPLGDSYAAATARELDAELLTDRDEHFEGLDVNLTKISEK